MDSFIADRLQEETKKLYTAIARQYSDSPGRAKPRPFIQKKLKDIPRGSSVLDVGCGNGIAVTELPDAVHYTGIDTCKAFIEIAQTRFPNKKFLYYDSEQLPFPNGSFDWALCIATLHHIPGEEKRKNFIHELYRVIKKDGKIVLTVWDQNTLHFFRYRLKNYFEKLTGKSLLDWNDCFYPWKNRSGDVIGERYFHAYTLHELTRVCREAGFEIVEKGSMKFRSKTFKNYFVILKK